MVVVKSLTHCNTIAYKQVNSDARVANNLLSNKIICNHSDAKPFNIATQQMKVCATKNKRRLANGPAPAL